MANMLLLSGIVFVIGLSRAVFVHRRKRLSLLAITVVLAAIPPFMAFLLAPTHE